MIKKLFFIVGLIGITYGCDKEKLILNGATKYTPDDLNNLLNYIEEYMISNNLKEKKCTPWVRDVNKYEDPVDYCGNVMNNKVRYEDGKLIFDECTVKIKGERPIPGETLNPYFPDYDGIKTSSVTYLGEFKKCSNGKWMGIFYTFPVVMPQPEYMGECTAPSQDELGDKSKCGYNKKCFLFCEE
jgi:hypothetical protein